MHPLHLLLLCAQESTRQLMLAHPYSSAWCVLDAFTKALDWARVGQWQRTLAMLLVVRGFVSVRVASLTGVTGFEDDLSAMREALGLVNATINSTRQALILEEHLPDAYSDLSPGH